MWRDVFNCNFNVDSDFWCLFSWFVILYWVFINSDFIDVNYLEFKFIDEFMFWMEYVRIKRSIVYWYNNKDFLGWVCL